jgi:hypothetical protein
MGEMDRNVSIRGLFQVAQCFCQFKVPELYTTWLSSLNVPSLNAAHRVRLHYEVYKTTRVGFKPIMHISYNLCRVAR